MLGDETLYIGQTAAGKMCPGDAEMVQKLGEARLDRRVPDGTDGGCYGRSPYSWIGTNNTRGLPPHTWRIGTNTTPPASRLFASADMANPLPKMLLSKNAPDLLTQKSRPGPFGSFFLRSRDE